MANLVDRGLISYETVISEIWSEFAQGNKENVTLKDILGHRGGITFLDKGPTLSELKDLDKLSKMLAAQSHNFNGKPIQVNIKY
jgi:CubicO group peptidase (beta-lactamase class C family)